MLRSLTRPALATSAKSFSSSSLSSLNGSARFFSSKPLPPPAAEDSSFVPPAGALEKPFPIPADVAVNYGQLEAMKSFYKEVFPIPERMRKTQPELLTPNKWLEGLRSHGGAYSALGLGLFFLFSKEYMHILDDHMSLLFLFAGIMQGVYIFALPEIRKVVWKTGGDLLRRQNGIFDLAKEVLKREIRHTEFEMNLGKMLREYKEELNELAKKAGQADILKAKAALYQETLAALKAIQQREQGEKAVFSQAVYEKTSAHVLKAFPLLPKAEKDILVDFAINVVAGKTAPLDSQIDPVKKLYRDYLNGKKYLLEIEEDKKKARK